VPKKNKKKKVNPAVLIGGNGKKVLKKKVQSRQPATVGHVSAPHSVPPFETQEWRKRQKKIPKMKVGHFEKIFLKGVRLKNFFANRVKKKKIPRLVDTNKYFFFYRQINTYTLNNQFFLAVRVFLITPCRVIYFFFNEL